MQTKDLVQRALGLIKLRLATAEKPAEAVGEPKESVTPEMTVDPATSREALQATMEADFLAFIRWEAEVYEHLPQSGRQTVSPQLQVFRAGMDQAYQDGDWATFQAALVGAKALLAEAQTEHRVRPSAQEHWCYRAWSRILDAEVWFVHCQQEHTRLIQQGVSRGAIYTESEMRDLLQLPQQPSPEMLRELHRVKQFFDFTIVTDVDETA